MKKKTARQRFMEMIDRGNNIHYVSMTTKRDEMSA